MPFFSRNVCRTLLLLCCASLWLFRGSNSSARSLEELDPHGTYRVNKIVISGNRAFSDADLLAVLSTKRRPWYLPWQRRPEFDPAVFSNDLKRIKLFYEAHGFYQARLTYDLKLTDGLVTVEISLDEDGTVKVARLTVYVDDYRVSANEKLYARLPLKPGDPFTEEAYQGGQSVLQDFFLDAGYAYVQVERRAEVDVSSARAEVAYSVRPGPQAVFGQTTVQGTESIDPRLVLRELTYKSGERFSRQRVTESRDKILRLQLFSSVHIGPARESERLRFVPMIVSVKEKPPRSITISGGYSTENLLGGQLEWHHYNWLGGARQLSILGRYSNINSGVAVTLTQPHFVEHNTQGVLSLRYDQDSEKPYLLNAERFLPRLEHNFTPALSAFIGCRLEYDRLNGLAPATIAAVRGVRRKGLLSGLSEGLRWDTTDNPLNPTRGEIVALRADQAAKQLGSDYRFYKFTVEGKKYNRLPWNLTLATRLKLATGDSLGDSKDLPLFERFYSGGEGSIRGYGRWELGPRSQCPPPAAGGSCNVPIGGRSVVEASIELRRPIYKALAGAVFLDAGQVSSQAFRLPVDDLRFGFGPALMLNTPVGPLRLDLGFPSHALPGEPHWQLYFSIGQFF